MINDIGEIKVTDKYGESLVLTIYRNDFKNENRVQIHLEVKNEEANDYMIEEDVSVDLSVSEFLFEIDKVRDGIYRILKEERKTDL